MKASPHTPVTFRARAAVCARAFLGVLAPTVLTLCLLGQTYVWRHGGLPLPAFAVEILRDRIQEEGLRLEFSEALLRPPGRVIVVSPRLESVTYPDLAISARSLSVEFSTRFRRERTVRPERFSIEGARLDCAAELTLSGEHETPVRDLHLQTIPLENGWRIESLRFDADGIQTVFSGEFPAPPPRPPEMEPPTWEEGLITAARALSHARQEVLQNVKNGALRGTTTLLPDNHVALRADFSFESFHHESGIQSERASGRVRFAIVPFAPAASGRLDIDLERVDYKTDGHLENARARIDIPRTDFSDGIPPVNVRLVAETFSALGEPAANLLIEGQSPGGHFANLEGYFEIAGKPLRGAANLNWKSGEGNAVAFGDANPTAILRNPLLRQAGFRFDVSFSDAPQTEASLRFGPGWEPQVADMEVRSGPCLIDGVALDSAQAMARWTPEAFDVHTMILEYADFRVSGSYWNDLNNRDYRFRYHGSVRPKHLSPWFEPWWENLWEPFDFVGPPPSAGIEISGRWGDNRLIQVSGWGHGEDLYLRGVPLDRLEARYEAGDTWALVSAARLDRPEGSARGSFRYERGDTEILSFLLESGIDAEAAARLLGDVAEPLTEFFDFETPPEMRMEGRIFQPEGTGPHPGTFVNFHGRTNNPVAVLSIPLERLELNARLEHSILTLDPVVGEFAGGDFEGTASLDLTETPPPLAVQAVIRDAAFGDGSATFAARFAPEMEEEALDNLRNLGGRANFELEIRGVLHEPHAFEGSGRIHITEAELGRIRLLGMLSRLLDLTPLRFTSLNLDELESGFDLQGDRVHFPDMRLAGPNVGMEARGDYIMESQALDFRVKLFPLRESPMPLVSTIIGRILEPLGHILEVFLTGTLEDPLWRLPIDPRRAFDEGEESPDRPRRTHGPAQQFGD